MLPVYNSMRFGDIYEDVASFLADYNSIRIPTTITEGSASTLFYLLYAKYGCDPISSSSPDQFKLRLFAIIFQYGPTWEKRLDIQQNLRHLTINELREGSKAIANVAMNPDTDPGTGDINELTYINQQNTNNIKKSIMGAYEELWSLLKVDVTEDFLNRFKQLFKQVVIPERTYIYTTEGAE